MLKGIAPPTPTIRSQANMVSAFYKRVAMNHPVHHPERIELAEFILSEYIPWVLKHVGEFQPVSDDEYIDSLDITESHKKILKDYCHELERIGFILDPRLRVIQAFIKLEFYEVSDKFPRVIMPQEEASRAAFGAPLSEINHAIMKLPTSIKRYSFAERPNFMKNLFGDDPVQSNDFSSFESSTDKWVINNVLRPIFLAITYPSHEKRVKMYMDYKCRPQNFKYGSLRFKSEPLMRSGDLDTASGNFFANDTAIAYASYKSGGLGVDHPRSVEGDDSVFKRIPGVAVIFRNLGFTAKLEDHDHLRDASFCRVYVGGTAALTDGIYVLSKLGWSSAKYLFAKKEKKLALLKAKCMSYLCQYAGCPIVGPVCDAVLSKLEGITEINNPDWWEQEKMKFWKPELRNKDVLPSDRSEYERLFKVTTAEQVMIEEECIDSITKWCLRNDSGETCLESSTALEAVQRYRPDWVRYYDQYAHVVSSDTYIKNRFNFRREKPLGCEFQDHIYSVFNR